MSKIEYCLIIDGELGVGNGLKVGEKNLEYLIEQAKSLLIQYNYNHIVVAKLIPQMMITSKQDFQIINLNNNE